jgi:hypothetical protein
MALEFLYLSQFKEQILSDLDPHGTLVVSRLIWSANSSVDLDPIIILDPDPTRKLS